MTKDTIIFDLDGTLADITARRDISHQDNGKMNWKTFFDPSNISLDQPNHPVINAARLAATAGFKVVIFSGRSKATKDATQQWLNDNGVPFDVLKMRPTSKDWAYMPDDQLKQHWLDDIFPGDQKDRISCVYDDRNKVVDMWRKNGIPCFQVAPGNF